MERAISVRLDDEAQRALASLTAAGRRQSDVIREALVELAQKRDRASLAAEVQRLASDPGDRAEKVRIAKLMDSLRAEG
jgi:Arc/MetJ-type ribon-helix-helix transcriptional regulator